MNLSELKSSVYVETDMSDIYSRIKRDARAGERYATFGFGSSCWEDEITETQVAILRQQGYTVEWNRPCLWYEVSGWK